MKYPVLNKPSTIKKKQNDNKTTKMTHFDRTFWN